MVEVKKRMTVVYQVNLNQRKDKIYRLKVLFDDGQLDRKDLSNSSHFDERSLDGHHSLNLSNPYDYILMHYFLDKASRSPLSIIKDFNCTGKYIFINALLL